MPVPGLYHDRQPMYGAVERSARASRSRWSPQAALQAGPAVLIRQFHPSPRTRGREEFLVHILEVLDDDLGVEFGDNFGRHRVTAMSIRILFASHVRCWTVGSLPYLFCHSVTCASASFSGNLASLSDHWPWNPTTHPSKSSGLYQDWARRQGTTHERTFRPHRDHRVAVMVEPTGRDGQDPPIHTNGHCNDGDQTQRPGHHQEPPEHAREVPPADGCAEKDATRVSGPGPPD